MNAKHLCIFALCHTEFFSFLPYLLALIVIEKQIKIVKQFGDWDIVKLCKLFHMVDSVIVPTAFLISDIGRAVNADNVCNLPLK